MPDIGKISVIIPAYNEAESIGEVISRSEAVLNKEGIDYEIVVIDSSVDDETAKAAQSALGNSGRVIRRLCGQAGLSLSVLEGIKEAQGDTIIVMDADASHPPELIPEFTKSMRQGFELVIASRYIQGSSTAGFPLLRRIISRLGCLLGAMVTDIKDNTSGFFCIKKACLEGVSLRPCGFKIGLEIFVKAHYASHKEIPYLFTSRKKGRSKLNMTAGMQYLYQVLCLTFYKIGHSLKK